MGDEFLKELYIKEMQGFIILPINQLRQGMLCLNSHQLIMKSPQGIKVLDLKSLKALFNLT